MRSAFPLLAALALIGCVTPPINDGPIRRDGEMVRIGETIRAGPLIVTPRAVIEDSRCPVNVQCVWAGRAIVRTDVAGAGWRETLSLTLGERVVTHGITLALTSVEPGKMAGAEAQPLNYRFGFESGR